MKEPHREYHHIFYRGNMIIRESEVPWFLILLKECDFTVIQEQRESFLSFELETDMQEMYEACGLQC